MNKFTFNDSISMNRTRKTKRWLGLLTFCALFFTGQFAFALEESNTDESVNSSNLIVATANANDDDPTPCLQISESTETASGWGLGGDNAQELAGDFIVYEGTTFDVNTIKVSVNASASTTFNIIFWSDNSGLPDTVLSSIDNVTSTNPVLSSGTYYMHTLDISSEDLSFTSPVGDTRYWMQVTTTGATAWERRLNSMIGVEDVYRHATTAWATITTDPDTFMNDLVYEVIGECTGSCLPPIAPTVITNSFTSVSLNWLSDGGLFDVEWGTSGFTLGTGTQINGITTNSTDITISGGTPYQFYVRQDCGVDGVSSWIGPIDFQTEYCAPTSNCLSGARITNFETADAILNIANETGSATCGITSTGYSNYSNLSASAPEGSVIPFTVGVGNFSAHVKLWVDWDNNGTFEASELLSESTVLTPAGNNYTGNFTVPTGTPNGDYRLRVRIVESVTAFDACSAQTYGETEDYTFTVIDPPACMPPSGLSVDGVTFTSVDLAWTSDGTLYDIEWGAQGFTQGSGTTVSGVSNPYTLTGLTRSEEHTSEL